MYKFRNVARTIIADNNRKKSTTRGKQSPRKPSAASAPAPRRASQSPRASPHSPQDMDETEKRFRAIECSIKKIELQLKLVDGEIMSNKEYAALTAEIIKCDAHNPDNLGEGTDFIMSVNNKRMDNRYKYILKFISIINPLLTACNIGFLQEIDTKEVSSELIGDAINKTNGYLNTLGSAINYFLENGNDGADKIDKLMDLNILCGINDTALVQLQSTNLALNSNVSNSMFLEKYHLDSLNLITQQKAFELKYKPQLNLFANTGLNAVYAPTIPNRFGISAGLSFTYNFFDGNQKAIYQNKTQVLEQSVSFYKSNFITQNTVRKSKILTELQSYTDRISIAEQQLKDYDLLLNSYKKEILSGQLSIINYTMVLKNMATIQRDYTLLFSQQQSLINAYNYWNW